MASFDSTQVLPSEFAALTITAVVGSAVVYGDFDNASIADVAFFVSGCPLLVNSDLNILRHGIPERKTETIYIADDELPHHDRRPFRKLVLSTGSWLYQDQAVFWT